MMDESGEPATDGLSSKDVFAEDAIIDEAIDVRFGSFLPHEAFAADQTHLEGGVVRTLDGEIAGDEFAQDAINYQILLGKIDKLLDNLKLDA